MEDLEIVGVRRQRGQFTEFKLSNGVKIDYQQAIELSQQGRLKGIDVIQRESGEQCLRDDRLDNMLDNLPEF